MVPGMATAGKKSKPAPEPQPGCSILVDKVIYTGNPYAVKVVRTPSYPGAWRNPTVSIEASYQGSTQSGSAMIDPSLANLFSVTYVTASLVVPDDASFGGTAAITATVKEPLKKRNTYRTTTCNVTTNIQ